MSETKHAENYITLQLGVQALMALLAGCGPEFKVQINKAVINSFAKHTVVKALDPEMRIEIQRAVHDAIGYIPRNWQAAATFTPEIREAIGSAARTAAAEAMREQRLIMNDAIKSALIQLIGHVPAYIEAATRSIVKKEFEQRVQAEVQERIKKALAS